MNENDGLDDSWMSEVDIEFERKKMNNISDNLYKSVGEPKFMGEFEIEPKRSNNMSEDKKSDFKIVEFVEIGETKKMDKWVGKTTEGKLLYWSKLAKDNSTRPMPPLNTKLSILSSVVAFPGGKSMEFMNYYKEDTHTPHTERLPIPKLPDPHNSPMYNQTVQPQTLQTVQKPPILPSKYSDKDLQAFRSKDEQMRRGCALNNAASLVLACSNSIVPDKHFSGMTIQEIIAYWKSQQKAFFEENLAMLEGKPFNGVTPEPAFDHVVAEEYVAGEDIPF